MAYASDKEPDELTALTSLDAGDVFVVGDISDASEVAKYITKTNLITDLSTSFAAVLGGDDNYVTDAEKTKLTNLSGTNTGDQTITNSSDATSHTVTLSASGGSVQLVEGTGITLTTSGTASAGVVTVASSITGNVTKVANPVNNEIGVWTGDGTLEGDPYLTWDESTLYVTSTTNPQILAINNDPGATGAAIELYHESTSPAANDVIGELKFTGKDSATNGQQYAGVKAVITDPTSTSEDGKLVMAVTTAGTLANELELTGAAVYPSTNDGLALGVAATGEYSDIFLAEGGVVNWDNGDVTLTQTGNVLAIAGGDFAPGTNDGAALGTSTLAFSDIYLATGANVLVNNANAKRSLILTASGGNPTTTIGCAAPTKVEAGTNDIDYFVLDFDTTTEERAFWNVVMPDNWDASTVTAQFYWTNAAGASTQTVDWGIKARAFADDAAIDQAYGSEVTTTDTWLAQGDVHISPVSTAITVGGSPAGGQYVVFNVGRKVASDNMAGDARLLAVKIEYGINAYSE